MMHILYQILPMGREYRLSFRNDIVHVEATGHFNCEQQCL